MACSGCSRCSSGLSSGSFVRSVPICDPYLEQAASLCNHSSLSSNVASIVTSRFKSHLLAY
eukprot:757508-Hanusia_phi.AAC.3